MKRMMKKRVVNAVMAVCALCLASCTGAKHCEGCREITVDIDKQADINDFIKSLDGYIFLETNDSSILQGIDKLKIENDTIYIADGDVLHLFGRKDGKWLGKIDRQGRGPGEYICIDDFDVCDSEIYVLSGDKIIVYDNSGSALRILRMDYGYDKFCVVDKNRIWLYSSRCNESKYNFVLIDPSDGNKLLAEYDPFEENESYLFSDNRPFCSTESGFVYTAQIYDNIVYRLSREGYEPAYEFDINLKNRITQEELHGSSYGELSDRYRNEESLRNIEYVTVDDNALFAEFSCFLSGRGYRDCFVKADLKTGQSEYYLVNEKIDPAFPLFDSGDIEGYDGKTVISSIYAAWAKKQGEEYGFEDLAAISEYDNPVLVFHTLNY